jgi:hypothetical protein
MMNKKQKLSLDRPEIYEIRVPGELDKHWSDWYGEMMITVGRDDNDQPVTTLTSTVDQAALQSLLRRLYSLGLPLISVLWVEIK